jgi:hypothetical protein
MRCWQGGRLRGGQHAHPRAAPHPHLAARAAAHENRAPANAARADECEPQAVSAGMPPPEGRALERRHPLSRGSYAGKGRCELGARVRMRCEEPLTTDCSPPRGCHSRVGDGEGGDAGLRQRVRAGNDPHRRARGAANRARVAADAAVAPAWGVGATSNKAVREGGRACHGEADGWWGWGAGTSQKPKLAVSANAGHLR